MVSIIRENAYVVHGVETLLTETNHVGVKAKAEALENIRLNAGWKRFRALQKGTCKTLRERQCWSQFFEMFLFLHENISQSVKGVFKRSAIVPAMKSNRCTKNLVNNVNLLLTRLLFPRLITPPIQWLERNASRQAIKHSASNLKLRITKTSRLKAFEVI